MIIVNKIPSSWDELSNRQFIKMAGLFVSGKSGLLFDYKCFIILLDLRFWQIWKIIKKSYTLSQVPMSEIKKSFDYIFEENGRTKFPTIPVMNQVQYYGPLEKMTNLTIHEFAVADDLHIKFRETKNFEYLHYLAAVLYVHHQQPRPAFDKNNLELFAKKFKSVDRSTLIAIELTFSGCKEYLSKRFPYAFPKAKSESKPIKKKNKGSVFAEIILKMAGGKFGTLKETRNTDLYAFLAEFNDNLKNPPKHV